MWLRGKDCMSIARSRTLNHNPLAPRSLASLVGGYDEPLVLRERKILATQRTASATSRA